MYGFNQIRDDKFIVGAELSQVCIGAHEIILNFYPYDISIIISDMLGFLANNAFLFEPLVGTSRRITQIGKTVCKLSILSNDTAVLLMSDGTEIILKDDSSEYEAVVFKCATCTIVV